MFGIKTNVIKKLSPLNIEKPPRPLGTSRKKIGTSSPKEGKSCNFSSFGGDA
jgi:hypothetical protein